MKNKSIFKPFFLMLLSSMAIFAFAKQEKVIQIFKSGEVVQEYALEDIDYIEVNDYIPAPGGLNANVSDNQITIKWNAVEGASYNVYRSPDNTSFILLASGIKETVFTDANPLKGSNFYRIKAIVGGAESGYTASVTAAISGTELESGIYLGITGFNRKLYDYPVLRLSETTVGGFRNFIDELAMENGTLLYYSVDQALNALQATELPADISTAAIITFTDGLDQGSLMKDVPYDDDMEYLDALSGRIKSGTVSGTPITAYSIGIRGKDVSDIATFRANLAKLASSAENAFEVSSMSEVNAQFQEIADKLSQSNYVQTINLDMPGASNGAIVRFTFDNVKSAEDSKLYIEGRFNLKERSLEDVRYVGLTSTSGSTIKGTVNDIFVNFKFEGVHTNNNVLIKSEFTDEWTYRAASSAWQINSEFDKTENSDIVTERSSAAIMLVLDCSKSLADDFVKMQSNAKDFINTLIGAVSDENEPNDDKAIYSTVPQDLSVAVWFDNQRYFLNESEYFAANLSNAYIEGLVVLYESGYIVISPRQLQYGLVNVELAMKYYSEFLPDLELAEVIKNRFGSITLGLSSFRFDIYESNGDYLTSECRSDGSNISFRYYSSYPGHFEIGSQHSTSGLVKGVKRMGKDKIIWGDPDDLSVSVMVNGERRLVKYDSDVDWSSYNVEGVVVSIADQRFVLLKDDAVDGVVHKDVALSNYSGILPTQEQAEVISMKSNDINDVLWRVGGTQISKEYLTKTPYDETNVYTFDNSGLGHNYSGRVRGVINL
ncbi:MAG: hypothetical protein NC102_09575 [Clostridium sp.]|nr:hypothetical protein [Clostridium sp.]